VQFLKLGIFACEPLTLFLLLPIKVNKVPKNLFGSVFPDFPVVTVVSIIAFLGTIHYLWLGGGGGGGGEKGGGGGGGWKKRGVGHEVFLTEKVGPPKTIGSEGRVQLFIIVVL
jgi:hypothetical protein